jgi:hypothetical protein
MSPLFRIWAMIAATLAVLLVLRGAWLAALAVFALSPAPALVFARGVANPQRLSQSWLVAIALAIVGFFALLFVIVSLGGLPQVHEWRALLRG